MVIYVDVDGTICTQDGSGNYEEATPVLKNIEKINALYKEGHKIYYWTARGSTTRINWIELTQQQLDDWGCLYHGIKIGKPEYDLWVDDKAKRIEEL